VALGIIAVAGTATAIYYEVRRLEGPARCAAPRCACLLPGATRRALPRPPRFARHPPPCPLDPPRRTWWRSRASGWSWAASRRRRALRTRRRTRSSRAARALCGRAAPQFCWWRARVSLFLARVLCSPEMNQCFRLLQAEQCDRVMPILYMMCEERVCVRVRACVKGEREREGESGGRRWGGAEQSAVGISHVRDSNTAGPCAAGATIFVGDFGGDRRSLVNISILF
jgi:hypothetical protein